MPFVIYDVETSGLDTTFDQVFQFAAIFTDDQLREVDSFSLRCRRLPHVIPSPNALIVTGVRPSDLEAAPLSHHQMALEVQRRFQEWSRGGAIFLGYNSIRFDEVLLRQIYFQNLLPLYQTNTNGNIRADVMRMVQACATFGPDAIAIPKDGKGRGTFKLSDVAKANGIELEHAHEALADTGATLGLARLLRVRAPEIWETMLNNAHKNGVENTLAGSLICFSDYYFGSPYNFIVTEIGRNANDDAEIALFDLAHDPEPYLGLSEEALVDLVSGRIKVIRRSRANSQPMLFPIDAMPKDIRGGALTAAEYMRRANLVRQHSEFQQRVGRVLARRYEDQPPSPYVEGRMYDGFPEDGDRALMKLFHATNWAERLPICNRFQDGRFRELAMRLIYVEHPDLVPEEVRAELSRSVANRVLTEEPVPWLTIPKALREIADIKRKAKGTELDFATEIEEYLLKLARSHGQG